MSDEYIDRISSFLTSHGITAFHFEHLAKHRAVIIPYNGRSNRVVFPLTGSDWRGPANTVSTIRHVLGLFEAKMPPNGTRRVRRHKTRARRARHVSRAPVSEMTTPRPDTFLGPLMILKARFEEAKATTEATADPTVIADSQKSPWFGSQIR